jgi:antitoxin Phd
MDKRWQLQTAKNRLSELVEQASLVGPQVITLRGKDKVVVISIEQYEKLTRPEVGLVEFFRSSPLVGLELDFERSPDTGRDIEL